MSQYITYEARLASFQKVSKKRGSAAGGRGKALNWPHKQLEPSSLAKAGFYFEPYPENPDNCHCFLCEKGLDGWEAGDDPLQEHLKHAPNCGWAIHAAIEAQIEEYSKQDPNLSQMVEARKSTFCGQWPHEGKRGWKCKTKQLVEAGWSYTPTEGSDDMATCAYCQLALDGWEQGDKPYDEHISRSPDCTFFMLLNQFGGAKKKPNRGKAARSSKASRLSIQSTTTAMSDMVSVADATVEPDDSVMTTASTMTVGGKKKAIGKKKRTATTTTKAGKAKSQKVQIASAKEGQGEVDADVDHDVSSATPKAAKTTRGKKRPTDDMDDSVTMVSEARALKKHASVIHERSQTEISFMTPEEDTQAIDASNKISRTSTSYTQPSKAAPSFTASVASLRAPPAYFPDDEEIERQLEADLERLGTYDEFAPSPDSMQSATKANILSSPQVEPKGRQQPTSSSQSNARSGDVTTDIHEDSDGDTLSPGPQRTPRRQETRSPALSKSRPVAEAPATPSKTVLPLPSARRAVLSPSTSPQASDAENLPPSSAPAASAKTTRIALAPVAATPMRNSPSKRRMILAGLQSETPWTAIDIDAVLGSPRAASDKENIIARLLKQGKELGSPEKRMTVEEWIYLNAGQAEEKLKHECEAMVTLFEKEGTRAMRVLEGLPFE